jgi:spermidine synthase
VTTREALKYKDVELISIVDIDEIVMDFGKNLEGFVKFNKGSLSDTRVETVIANAALFR